MQLLHTHLHCSSRARACDRTLLVAFNSSLLNSEDDLQAIQAVIWWGAVDG